MNKRDRMNEQILNHGMNLKRVFFAADPYGEPAPVSLYKSLHRIEVRAHRLAEDYCNGVIDIDQWDRAEKSILASIDKLLHYKSQDIPVFVNGDPRGYALKINDQYVREHKLDIYRDWGGYGILAPEFDGN